MLLQKIAHSVAMGAVMDQKQRWAAVMQVEPLRKVVAEALHQVSQSQVFFFPPSEPHSTAPLLLPLLLLLLRREGREKNTLREKKMRAKMGC